MIDRATQPLDISEADQGVPLGQVCHQSQAPVIEPGLACDRSAHQLGEIELTLRKAHPPGLERGQPDACDTFGR